MVGCYFRVIPRCMPMNACGMPPMEASGQKQSSTWWPLGEPGIARNELQASLVEGVRERGVGSAVGLAT